VGTTIADVDIYWRLLGSDDDPGWGQIRCLYAYYAPRRPEVLYIGKVWGVSVRGRWRRTAKAEFWNDLEEQRGIKYHRPVLGQLAVLPHIRVTRKLLAAVESLLIQRVQPWGNIQSRQSRIARPGLTVRCRGLWPHGTRFFRDE
jgi:hypothetical protein